MNRDPFLRLALVTLTSLYVFGMVVIGLFFGALIAGAVSFWGIVGAAVLTIVLERGQSSDEAPVEDLRQRHRQPAEGTRGFERIE